MDGMDVVGESVMSIEALFLLLSDGGGPKAVRANLGPLRECLQCVVRLCRVQPEACDQFVDIIGGLLLQTGENMEHGHSFVLQNLPYMMRGLFRNIITFT